MALRTAAQPGDPMRSHRAFAALPMNRREPEPLRIVAIAVAIAFHAGLAMLVFRPGERRPPADDDALVVEVVPATRRPPSVPSPPRRASVAAPRPATPTARTVPVEAAPVSAPTADVAPPPRPDPAAPPGIVVFHDRAAIGVVIPDTPPLELPSYRAAFDPDSIQGLDGPASGFATFDVLIDGSGVPTGVVIVQQGCDDRALEMALSVISQWRFVPATREGLPVAAWLRVPLEF